MDKKQTREYNKLIRRGFTDVEARKFILDLSDDENINQVVEEVEKVVIEEFKEEQPPQKKLVRVNRPIANCIPPFLYVYEN